MLLELSEYGMVVMIKLPDIVSAVADFCRFREWC